MRNPCKWECFTVECQALMCQGCRVYSPVHQVNWVSDKVRIHHYEHEDKPYAIICHGVIKASYKTWKEALKVSTSLMQLV